MTQSGTLLGYKELAERWGVTTDALRVRRHRGNMPEPDIWVNNGPVWYETTIEKHEQGEAHDHRETGDRSG